MPRRLGNVDEEVEAVAGYRHDGAALSITDIGRPLVRGADRGILRHQAVEVRVPRVGAFDAAAGHVVTHDRSRPVGADQQITAVGGAIVESHRHGLPALGNRHRLAPQMDAVHPDRLHEQCLQLGPRHGVRALTGLRCHRLKRELAHRLSGEAVDVGHVIHPATERSHLVGKPQPVEDLHPVRPQRQCRTDRLVLAHPVVDDDLVAEPRQRDPGTGAADSCADDDDLHVVNIRERVSRPRYAGLSCPDRSSMRTG